MKKYFKSILCSVVFSFILCGITHINAGAAVAEGHDSILVQLGILDSDIAKSDETVTRAEFGVIVTDILTWNGLDSTGPATRQLFTDVSQWDWVSENLEFLYNRGIIQGYDDNTFRPDEPIETAAAYYMLLKVLGYDSLISVYGNYPVSVMTAAQTTGLNDHIGNAYNEPMTGKMTAILLDNFLNTRVMQPGGSSSRGNIKYETGDIFMNDYMSLYEYDGVITGVPGLSILGNKVRAEEIEIDGTVYTNHVSGLEGMLGYEITYYIEIDDHTAGDVRAVIPKRKSSELKLESRDVLSYENRQVRYVEDDREKIANISGTADIVINGTAKTESDVYVPAYGEIKLIDNDGDRRYDVVLISDYDTIIVETVNLEKNIIYGQNTDKDDNKYVLELEKYDYVGIFDENGNSIELDAIKSRTVLTAEIADFTSLRLYYSQRVTSGEVKLMQYEENTMNITLGDTEYHTTDNLYTQNGAVSIGASGEFLLDFKGNIAAAILNKNGAWNFGYLLRAYVNDGDESISLKLLTETGKIENISCTENLKIDSSSVTDQAGAAAMLNTPQLIRYRMKQDQINLIDLADIQPMTDFTDRSGDQNNTLLKRACAPMQYKPSVSTWKERTWSSTITNLPQESVIHGESYLTANTVIFQVPINRAEADDSDYAVIKKSSLTANQQSDVESYNTSAESIKAEAIVVYQEDTEIKVAAKLFIVEKVIESVTDEGEPSYDIQGWYSGSDARRTLKNAELISVGSHKISKGDIIRTRQDDSQVTTNLELVYSADGQRGMLMAANPWSPDNVVGTSFDVEMRCLLGNVIKKSDSAIILDYGAVKSELFDISSSTIYVLNLNGKSRDFVYMGTLGDIEEGSRVIISTRASIPTEIIVLK